jgi:hypothetical protein
MATPIKTDRLSFLEQELKNLEEQGFVWRPRTLQSEQRARAIFDGK